MSPPEPINQNSSQQTPQVEELNNLIDKMNIEKSLNKRKVSTPSTEIKNQDESKDITEDTSESARKNKERAAARKSRLNKTQQKGRKNHEEYVSGQQHQRSKKLIHDKQKKIFKKLSLKKNKKFILTLFYKMTINNGTKKIEAPPEKIPCTCYVGSSVGMISILI